MWICLYVVSFIRSDGCPFSVLHFIMKKAILSLRYRPWFQTMVIQINTLNKFGTSGRFQNHKCESLVVYFEDAQDFVEKCQRPASIPQGRHKIKSPSQIRVEFLLFFLGGLVIKKYPSNYRAFELTLTCRARNSWILSG